MTTTRDEIRQWFERGVAEGKIAMIVMCDTFDWGDYPVYVNAGQDTRALAKSLDGQNMQKLMEFYDLSIPAEPQLSAGRSFNFPLQPKSEWPRSPGFQRRKWGEG